MKRFSWWLVVACVLATGVANAQPAILDRSVLGYWKFDGATDAERGADVSGWGGTALSLGSGMSYVASGSYDGSGYLNISTAGATATATLGGGHTLSDSAYQTVLARYKSSCTISEPSLYESFMSDTDRAYVNKINDHDNWHQILLRYQSGSGSSGSTAWRSAIDPETFPTWWSSGTRADVGNNNKPQIPASVSGGTLTVGGKVGISSITTDYAGAIDEVVVLNRLMSIRELSRYYQTGETYVYISPEYTGDAACAWLNNWEHWSTVENDYKPVPGTVPGAAYMVDRDCKIWQNENIAFGYGNHNSLTLGRLEPLVNKLDGSTLVAAGDTLKGHVILNDGVAVTSVSFYDLRLNNGSLQFSKHADATQQTLGVEYLDVGATAASPFSISIPSGHTCTMTVAQPVTGDGVLAKVGYGTLVIEKFDSADGASPKIRLKHGTIKTPVLNGYQKDVNIESGTVLVSATGTPVVFKGDDLYLPTTTNKMKIKFDGAVPTQKTAVMTVPSGITAEMIQDTTTYDAGKVSQVTVENGTVYVTSGYPEDLGNKVILIGE